MRRVILAIVGTAAGLVALLSFKTHSTSATAAAPPAAVSPAATPSASSSVSGTSSTSSSAGGSSAGTTTTAKTVTGNAVDTNYGPVQVQITVKSGKIIAATAVQYPQESPRDQQINSYAVPTLNSETVSADSASIDMVSGATYTSNGYISSLQSALDKAGS